MLSVDVRVIIPILICKANSLGEMDKRPGTRTGPWHFIV